MFSKVISILTLILILKLIECQDICKLITSDGKYKGLGIYNRFNLNEKRSFVMYTDEKEWFFDITGSNPGVVLKDMDIQMIKNSVKYNPNPKSIRFGLFLKINSIENTYDCYVKNGTNTKWILNCNKTNLFRSEVITRDEFPPFDSFVTFKRFPIKTTLNSDGGILLVINKHNKKQCISYDIKRVERVSTVRTPLFISQMDDKLFRQIEAVLDFNYGGNTGYLLLFNINGRPKHCFTSFGKNISPECNSTDKMSNGFDHCFQTGLTTQTTTLRTTENPKNRNIRYAVIILVIAMIFLILFISGLYCVKKWRKKRPITEKTSSTPSTQKQTPISSVKKTESGKSSKTSEVLPPKRKTQISAPTSKAIDNKPKSPKQ